MNKTRFLYITVMLILADINSWYINPVCSRPPKNVINKALSRRSRATTAEECTKKCDE